MSEYSLAESSVERATPKQAERQPRSALSDGPILRTLLSLAWPNIIANSAGTCVVIAETSYIGRLGIEALAAMALVFPLVILTMTMSGGAMGGGVASAIARALGAGDTERASTLVAHALLIALCFGATFMVGMLMFGPRLLQVLGGRGAVLEHAAAYLQVFFGGAILPWLMNAMAGILRGTGNMKLPSFMILNAAVLQIVLGGTLSLGLGLGMRGVAAGALLAFSASISVMGWYLLSGRARVRPKLYGLKISRAMFADILKVGAIACFSPLQSVLSIAIFTHMLATFGTAVLAGYGIGARLEFMMTTVAFSFGMASVPMVGMAVGAERIARARRIAWTAALVSFVTVGALSTVIAIFPQLWVDIFTQDPSARAAGAHYLRIAAPMYAFIGLAIALYFASQGAAKVIGPVLVQTVRLVFIAAGGSYLLAGAATETGFFLLAASSMVLLGVLTLASVMLTRWGPKPVVAELRPAVVAAELKGVPPSSR